MKTKHWPAVLGLVLLITLNAGGTYVELSTTVDLPNIINNTLTLGEVSITNLGDEPAFNTIIEPLFPEGFSSEEIVLGDVKPNQTVKGVLQLNIHSSINPGRYAMALLIRYNDLNDYPSTFITPLRFSYRKAVQSDILVVFEEEVELKGNSGSTLVLIILNRDYDQRQVLVRLHTPNQITVDGVERVVVLPPNSKTMVEFNVSSLGALPGGSFFVFASVDYVEGGVHYSSSGNGRVVTSKESSIGFLAPVILGVVVVLILYVVHIQLKKK